MSTIITTKSSGLTLVRSSCGCERWMRVLTGGRVHTGRKAKSCGIGGLCADGNPGAMHAEAEAALLARGA